MKLTPLAALSTRVSCTPPSAVKPSCSTLQFFNPLKLHRPPFASQYPHRIHVPRRLSLAASASNGKGNGRDDIDNREPLTKEAGGIEGNESKNNGGDGGGGNGNGNGSGRPKLNLKWVDLLLDPDPDNVVAVGLTGVLAWASVQVLWQLFVISVAILLAALKYSFVAALLIFILITLL